MRRAQETSSAGRRRIANALLAAQEKGDLSGICGRLGDLGQISSEFDVAASTAGSGALDFVVVERTHHAQRAVEYLKRHSLGRATMLILEKQKGFANAMRPIDTPQNAPRLFDLIEVTEPRFAPAFYFVYRDALCADSLESANAIAFAGGRRWKVVTKSGQLIEQS